MLDMESPLDKLEIYQKEIADDLKINDMTLSDKTFDIPQKKHYWVAKLILEKRELLRLERSKKQLEKEVMKKLQDDMPVTLSKQSNKSALNSTQTMQNINQAIEDQKLLVEYLEKTEKIFSFITNDVRNILELKQMELM